MIILVTVLYLGVNVFCARRFIKGVKEFEGLKKYKEDNPLIYYFMMFLTVVYLILILIVIFWIFCLFVILIKMNII